MNLSRPTLLSSLVFTLCLVGMLAMPAIASAQACGRSGGGNVPRPRPTPGVGFLRQLQFQQLQRAAFYQQALYRQAAYQQALYNQALYQQAAYQQAAYRQQQQKKETESPSSSGDAPQAERERPQRQFANPFQFKPKQPSEPRIAPIVRPTGFDRPFQPAPAAEVDQADKNEEDAARKLKFAKMLASDGLVDKARIRYGEIVEKYPGTEAAKEAAKLLQ